MFCLGATSAIALDNSWMRVGAFIVAVIWLVGLVYSLRLFVRAFRQMHAWGRTGKRDPLARIMSRIELKNTLWLELFGWAIASAATIAMLFVVR